MKNTYEADSFDIDFLKQTLLPQNPGLERVSFESLIRYFEKFIIYMEEKELSEFVNRKKVNHKTRKKIAKFCEISRPKMSFYSLRDFDHDIFSLPNQSLIFDYWRKKQNFYKRPLLRKYWKVLHIPNHNFGSQDFRKLSFAPRTLERKQTRFKDRLFRTENAEEQILELLKESHDLMELVRLVTFREKVKMQQVLFEFSINKNNLRKRVTDVDYVLDEVEGFLEFNKGKEVGLRGDFEGGKEEAFNFQDRLLFLCNLVEELDNLGFRLSDFGSQYLAYTSQELRDIQTKILNFNPHFNENLYFPKSKRTVNFSHKHFYDQFNKNLI